MPPSASNGKAPADNEKLSPSMSGQTATETFWFALKAKEVAARVETSLDDGLSKSEADSRLKRDGPNELQGGGGVSPWKILFGQVCSASQFRSRRRRRRRN